MYRTLNHVLYDGGALEGLEGGGMSLILKILNLYHKVCQIPAVVIHHPEQRVPKQQTQLFFLVRVRFLWCTLYSVHTIYVFFFNS